MTRTERTRKLLLHFFSLWIGLSGCYLLGWLGSRWELHREQHSGRTPLSDTGFNFTGIGSVMIAGFLGIVLLIVWTVKLWRSSAKHKSDKTFYRLNNLVIALPYLWMLLSWILAVAGL